MRLHGASDCMRASRVQLAAQAAARCPRRPWTDASSPDTWFHIAMAITVHVPAYASLHRLADAVKGGELSYMAPGSDGTRAKLTAYSSLMELVDPESMLARLIHCSILRDGLHSSYAH